MNTDMLAKLQKEHLDARLKWCNFEIQELEYIEVRRKFLMACETSIPDLLAATRELEKVQRDNLKFEAAIEADGRRIAELGAERERLKEQVAFLSVQRERAETELRLLRQIMDNNQ